MKTVFQIPSFFHHGTGRERQTIAVLEIDGGGKGGRKVGRKRTTATGIIRYFTVKWMEWNGVKAFVQVHRILTQLQMKSTCLPSLSHHNTA